MQGSIYRHISLGSVKLYASKANVTIRTHRRPETCHHYKQPTVTDTNSFVQCQGLSGPALGYGRHFPAYKLQQPKSEI